MHTTTDAGGDAHGRRPTTMLGIWAHPDDEVFLSGGLMAAAVRLGVRVVCAHATRGERGIQEGHPFQAVLLPRIRAAELRQGLAALGVEEQHQMDYPDFGLDRISTEEGEGWVRCLLDHIRPDVVVTFGPDGFTGHPDHRVLSRWVTEAAAAAPGHPAFLHAKVSAAWRDRFVPAFQEFDGFFPGYPLVSRPEEVDVHLDLDPELIEKKVAALRAHLSQTGRLFRAFGEEFMRALAGSESFSLAAGSASPRFVAELVSSEAESNPKATLDPINIS